MKLISFRAFRKQCYLLKSYPTTFTVNMKEDHIYKTAMLCKQINTKTGKAYLCTAKTCPYFSKLKDQVHDVEFVYSPGGFH